MHGLGRKQTHPGADFKVGKIGHFTGRWHIGVEWVTLACSHGDKAQLAAALHGTGAGHAAQGPVHILVGNGGVELTKIFIGHMAHADAAQRLQAQGADVAGAAHEPGAIGDGVGLGLGGGHNIFKAAIRAVGRHGNEERGSQNHAYGLQILLHVIRQLRIGQRMHGGVTAVDQQQAVAVGCILER